MRKRMQLLTRLIRERFRYVYDMRWISAFAQTAKKLPLSSHQITPRGFLVLLAGVTLLSCPASSDIDLRASTVKVSRTADTLTLETNYPGADSPQTQTFKIIKIAKDRPFYHWSPPADGGRWAKQGHIDTGELEHLLANSTNMVAGGGYYVAASPTSSETYGTALTVVEPQMELDCVEDKADRINWTPKTQEALRAHGISMVSYGGNHGDWFNIFDAKALQRVRSGTATDYLQWLTTNKKPPSFSALITLDAKLPITSDAWLAEHFPEIDKILTRQPLNAAEKKKLAVSSAEVITDLPTTDSRLFELAKTQVDLDDVLDHYLLQVQARHHSIGHALVQFEAKVQAIAPGPALKKHFPVVNKWLSGEKLSSSERSKIWDQIYYSIDTINPNGAGPRSQLVDLLARDFKPELARYWRGKFTNSKRNALSAEGAIRSAREWGIDLAELIPGSEAPRLLFPESLRLNFTPKLLALPEFGQNLAASLSFIDYGDLLTEMARGSSAPWKRYDQPGQKRPLLERWREATQSRKSLIERYQIVSESTEPGYRSIPIEAGGDIFPDGVNGKGYYRITAHQRKALEANPFLTIEIREDPSSPLAKKSYLARHEYPSARTYQNFRSHLSVPLQNKLDTAQAAGSFTDISSPDFKMLTQEILQELVREPAHAYNETSLQAYHRLISVHPFSDFNGRTLRADFQATTGRPLFLKNWDNDILMSYEELVAADQAGEAQWKAIVGGLAKEAEIHPAFPRFYDVPEIWMAASGTDQVAPGDVPRFVDNTRVHYADPVNVELMRQKRGLEIEQKLDDNAVRYALGITDPKRRDVALARIIGDLKRVALLDQGLAQPLLDEVSRIIKTPDHPLRNDALAWVGRFLAAPPASADARAAALFSGLGTDAQDDLLSAMVLKKQLPAIHSHPKLSAVVSAWAKGATSPEHEIPAIAFAILGEKEELAQGTLGENLGKILRVSKHRYSRPPAFKALTWLIESADTSYLPALLGIATSMPLADQGLNQLESQRLVQAYDSALSKLDEAPRINVLIRGLASNEKPFNTSAASHFYATRSMGEEDIRKLLVDLSARAAESKFPSEAKNWFNAISHLVDGHPDRWTQLLESAREHKQVELFFGYAETLLEKSKYAALLKQTPELAADLKKGLRELEQAGLIKDPRKRIFAQLLGADKDEVIRVIKDTAPMIGAHAPWNKEGRKIFATLLDQAIQQEGWTEGIDAIIKKASSESTGEVLLAVLSKYSTLAPSTEMTKEYALLRDHLVEWIKGVPPKHMDKLIAGIQALPDLNRSLKQTLYAGALKLAPNGGKSARNLILADFLITTSASKDFPLREDTHQTLREVIKKDLRDTQSMLIRGSFRFTRKEIAQARRSSLRDVLDGRYETVFQNWKKTPLDASFFSIIANAVPHSRTAEFNEGLILSAVRYFKSYRGEENAALPGGIMHYLKSRGIQDPRLTQAAIEGINEFTRFSSKFMDFYSPSSKIENLAEVVQDSGPLDRDSQLALLRSKRLPYEPSQITVHKLRMVNGSAPTDPLVLKRVSAYLLHPEPYVRDVALKILEQANFSDPSAQTYIHAKLGSYISAGHPPTDSFQKVISRAKLDYDKDFKKREPSAVGRKLRAAGRGCIARALSAEKINDILHVSRAITVIGTAVGGPGLYFRKEIGAFFLDLFEDDELEDKRRRVRYYDQDRRSRNYGR